MTFRVDVGVLGYELGLTSSEKLVVTALLPLHIYAERLSSLSRISTGYLPQSEGRRLRAGSALHEIRVWILTILETTTVLLPGSWAAIYVDDISPIRTHYASV